MNNTSRLSILIAAAGILSCGPSWQRVSIAEVAVTVEMPGPVESGIDVLDSEVGEIRFAAVQSLSGASEPRPIRSGPPIAWAQAADVSALSAKSRGVLASELEKKAAEATGGQAIELAEKRDFAGTACSGTEIVVATEHIWNRTRICFVDKRLLVMAFAGTKQQVMGSAGERFFGSVVIR